MKDIQEFKIDAWIRKYAPGTSIGLHGSYASALSLNDLQNLAPGAAPAPIDPDLTLTYGAMRGSTRLRESIAEIHSSERVAISADDVIITPGSILANYHVLSTLCGPGDHVICQYPTYGQLYLVPQFSGVDVSLWALREDKEWSLDIDELIASIKPNTKVIILNNPNNPTGAVLSNTQLEQIIDIARQHEIAVFSDEVFSPLFFSTDKQSHPSPLVALGYPKSVSSGSLSKAYGLPGLRIGWIVTKDEDLKRKIIKARDFTTISVSQLDDGVGAYALSPTVRHKLLERNIALCKESISLLDEFVQRNASRCRWKKPQGAGTAFIQLLGADGAPLDDASFSAKVATEGGVSVIPGSHAFGDKQAGDFKGYIRITLGEPQRLPEGLKVIEEFLHASE